MVPELERIALHQSGVVFRRQAISAGYSPAEVGRQLRHGSWIQIRRGVYAVEPLPPAGPARLAIRAAAARLVLDGPAAISHHSAAALLGLLIPSGEPPWITLTRPPGAGSTRRGAGLNVHVAALPTQDIVVRHQLPVTSCARTVVDLARSLPIEQGLMLADSVLFRQQADAADLHQVTRRCWNWPGIRSAQRVLSIMDGRAESALESLCRLVFAQNDLPQPELQVVLGDEWTGWNVRVDFLWSAERTVVEADGMNKYTDSDVLRAEKLRQERIEELGYAVVRVTWTQIMRDRPNVIARIRAAFDRQAIRNTA